jgi:hypothetical protein
MFWVTQLSQSLSRVKSHLAHRLFPDPGAASLTAKSQTLSWATAANAIKLVAHDCSIQCEEDSVHAEAPRTAGVACFVCRSHKMHEQPVDFRSHQWRRQPFTTCLPHAIYASQIFLRMRGFVPALLLVSPLPRTALGETIDSLGRGRH